MFLKLAIKVVAFFLGHPVYLLKWIIQIINLHSLISIIYYAVTMYLNSLYYIICLYHIYLLDYCDQWYNCKCKVYMYYLYYLYLNVDWV